MNPNPPLRLQVVLPRKHFTAMFASLAKSLPRRLGHPDVRLVVAGEGDVTLSVHDRGVLARRSLRGVVTVSGSVMLFGKKTFDLLGALTDDFVTIEVREDYRVRVTCGSRVFEYQGGEPGRALAPIAEPQSYLGVRAEALRRALTQVTHAVGRTSISPEWSKGIRVSLDGYGLRFTATDNLRLATAEILLAGQIAQGPEDPLLVAMHGEGVVFASQGIAALIDLAEEAITRKTDLALALQGPTGREALFVREETLSHPGLVLVELLPAHTPGLASLQPPTLLEGTVQRGYVCAIPASELRIALRYVLTAQASESSPYYVTVEVEPRGRGFGTLTIRYDDPASSVSTTAVVACKAERLEKFGIHGKHFDDAARAAERGDEPIHLILGELIPDQDHRPPHGVVRGLLIADRLEAPGFLAQLPVV